MGDVVLALMRTLASLRSGRIWAYVLAPALVSLILWITLALWGLGQMVNWLLTHQPMTRLIAWGVAWLATLLAYMGAWMAIFGCAYLTASLLAAIVVMPLLLKHLAASDYRDVAPMGKDSFVAAAVNSVLASILFIAGWILTLPFWIIPGLSLILPLLLMAWYNRRTFAYDALSMHATEAEWKALRPATRGSMFMLGLTMALLAHVPLHGLLVPALAALSFVNYGLEALRRSRGGAIVTIERETPWFFLLMGASVLLVIPWAYFNMLRRRATKLLALVSKSITWSATDARVWFKGFDMCKRRYMSLYYIDEVLYSYNRCDLYVLRDKLVVIPKHKWLGKTRLLAGYMIAWGSTSAADSRHSVVWHLGTELIGDDLEIQFRDPKYLNDIKLVVKKIGRRLQDEIRSASDRAVVQTPPIPV